MTQKRYIRRELSHKQFFDCLGPEYDSAEPDTTKIESTYSIVPSEPESKQLDAALEMLSAATSSHKIILSESSPLSNSAAQKTLQSLSELTAFISSQTYSVPSSFRGPFTGSLSSQSQNTLGPAEEEVRRELRALKGLLLNRWILLN
jgi:hypothetical protein